MFKVFNGRIYELVRVGISTATHNSHYWHDTGRIA